jgi:FkbM family methyltransferase
VIRRYVSAVRREPRPVRFLMSRALWRSGLCRLLTVQQEGYRIRFHPSSVSASLWLDPGDRAATPAFLRRYLGPGDIVVDVGANVGTTALAAAVAVGDAGRVLAIEPHPRTFRFLLDNLELNGARNVRACAVAIGAREGAASFSDELWDDANRVVEDASGRVPLKRLDEVVDVPAIDLLKVDVEGYELRVLEGAERVLARTACVYLESWEEAYQRYGYTTQDVLELLRERGFAVFFEPTDEQLRPVPGRYASPRNENLVACRDAAELARRLGGVSAAPEPRSGRPPPAPGRPRRR